MQSIDALVSEAWRFLRLLAAGVAWGAPLAWFGAQFPGTVAGIFFYLCPLLGAAGVACLATFSGPASPLRRASVIVIPLLVSLALLAASGLFFVVLIALAAVGISVTLRTLWQFKRSVVLWWLIPWLAVLAWGVSLPRSGAEDLGAGIIAVLQMTSLLGAATAASLVAYFGCGMVARLRSRAGGAHLTSASS